MKRLLAYLFLVLGLGLLGIDSTPSYSWSGVIEVCKGFGGGYHWVKKHNTHGKYNEKKIGSKSCTPHFRSNGKEFYHALLNRLKATNNRLYTHVINKNSYDSVLAQFKTNTIIKIVTQNDAELDEEKKKIAEEKKKIAEEKKKIAKEKKKADKKKAEEKKIADAAKVLEQETIVNLILCLNPNRTNGVIYFAWENSELATLKSWQKKCHNASWPYQVSWKNFPKNNKVICYDKNRSFARTFQPSFKKNCEGFGDYNVKLNYDGNNFYYGGETGIDNTQTQIAKAEPSQTQPVKEFTKIVGEGIGSDYINTYELTSGGKPTKKTKWSLKFAEERACLEAQKNTYKNAFTKSGVPTNNNINRFLIAAIVNETVLRKDIDIDINDKNLKCDYSAELLVKTSELNKFATKFKKKVKVAKVAEPKQEEFKPKKTNQDNEAPVIEIAEAITVDSQAYTLKGKVKDKSQVYLTIDGRQVDVKKGKFKLDRFNIDPDVAENIKIVAIDKWNNRTEKTIKVTIDLQSTDIAKVYEELKPNNVKVKTDKNKIAIIIGIEKYENLTNLDAKYANRDAKAFRTYATRALGIKPSIIKVLIDDKANRGNTLEAFKIWLPKIAGKGGKDIHIFFAGHGLASENGKDLYILPQDGNAKLLDDTAITRLELITLIQKVNPKSVTMFFDTCYSGQTRDERMLVASLLRPIQIISEEQDTPDNFTIFSASNYDQVSGGIEEAQHGMFSYYLMKGLEGNADDNKDKKITNGELITYLKDNVSEEAFTQNREQDPMLAGDPDKVLMSYR